MANNHGLRTTGVHTGNFGRPKVQGRPGDLDLTGDILTRENLRIPRRDEAFTKLQEAYNTTTDPKLKAGLWEILKRRQAATRPVKVQSNQRPASEYWDRIKQVR